MAVDALFVCIKRISIPQFLFGSRSRFVNHPQESTSSHAVKESNWYHSGNMTDQNAMSV